MARRYSDDEGLQDNQEEPEEDYYSESDQEGAPATAQQRKYEALKPPIASLCSALGGVEEFRTEDGEIYSEYSLGDQVVGCLKDLKRFWRMDERDDDRTVARIFHDVGLLKNDLIPILLTTLGTSAKGDRIALACVELIGAMTWPINVAEELRDAQLLDELRKSIDYTSLISAQLSYKAIILRTGALRAMFQLMSPALTKTRRERTTKDENIISLVLHTFRNLAALKDRVSISDSADAIEQSGLQSEYIQQLASEQIFDLLIAIAHNAESTEYAPWNMVALDIFHLIFRCVKPTELMTPTNKIDENRLKDLLDLEGKKKKTAAKLSTSRHSRFGTTVALKAGKQQYIMHKQSTLHVGAEQTMDKIKRSKAKKIRQDDDLAPPSHLRPEAVECLRTVALSFLDSAFNPFFSSVLKDIRMERLKVKESDTIRFLFLSRFFLEFFLLVYNDEKRQGIDPQSEEGHDFDLIAEMTEPQSIGFVTARMKGALEEKPPLWTDLHAGIDCYIQILLVIEALQLSGVQDHIDVAEILQHKLYYEADSLDMVLNVIMRFKQQSHKYLDSVINLSYVLLRMLEKYSKSKAYMYVRKKKSRASKKKKNKEQGLDEGDGIGMGDDEEDEVDRSAPSFAEHAFNFGNFEERFAEEAVLDTFVIYLESYKSFQDPEQLKRIVSLMHRQAVKTKTESLFFKPSVLELFQRILQDEALSASKDQQSSDLKKLVEYILKKFFKAAKEKPMLLVEAFFPKSSKQLRKSRLGDVDYYESSEDEGPGFKFLKTGEVEVQPGFSLTQQVGIAVACLVDAGDLSLVELIQAQLALASAARTEIVLTTDGDNSAEPEEDDGSDEALRKKASRIAGPSKDAVALFTPHAVDFGGEETTKAATVNSHFKLLMTLLQWEKAEVPDSDELVWLIPTSLMPSTLDGDHKIIADFLLDPVDPNGKTAADLLRKKRKAPVRKRKERAPRLNSDGEEVEEEMDAPAKKRQKKRKEEAEAYKSAQFIEDSDDDEAADAAFFAREAELRLKIAQGVIVPVVATGSKVKKGKPTPATSSAANSKSKGKGRGKKKQQDSDSDSSEGGQRVTRRPKKAPKKTTFNSELVSDISDDDELMGNLEKMVAKEARPQGTSKSPSDGGRKRSASVTSTLESSPAPSAAKVVQKLTAGSDSDEEEAVGAVSQAKKKRRVVLDSDDE